MPLIREVWAFDWQNHGDSAILNEEVIKIRELRISEILHYATMMEVY